MASQIALRVFSVAHTAAKPEDTCSQPRNTFLPSGDAIAGCMARSGLGSVPECLPKKFSSSTATRDVCESVEPIIPNLKGFTPSFFSN